MRLENVVKYVNAVYAGFCLGLLAYFAWLIVGGKTLAPKAMFTLSELFRYTALGPLTMGCLPLLLAAYISFTIVVITLNVFVRSNTGR